MITMFDTLQYAKKAKEAGFTEAQAEFQAEALAAIMEDNFATKSDLSTLSSELRSEMSALSSELRSEMSALSSELKAKMSLIEKDMHNIRGEIIQLEEKLPYKLTVRLGGMLAAAVTILGVLITVLHN